VTELPLSAQTDLQQQPPLSSSSPPRQPCSGVSFPSQQRRLLTHNVGSSTTDLPLKEEKNNKSEQKKNRPETGKEKEIKINFLVCFSPFTGDSDSHRR
jgi:hypothetical protein